MKTIMRLMIIVILLCAKVSLAQTVGVRIPDTSGVRGTVMDIPVYVDSTLTGKGVISYQLKIYTYLTGINLLGVVNAGTMSSGFSAPLYSVNVPANTITITSAGTTPLSGTGVLLYLRVELKVNANIWMNFNGVTDCFFNQGTPVMTFKNGSVYVYNAPSITASYGNSNPLTLGDSVQVYVGGGTSPYTYSVTNPSVATISSSGMLKSIGVGTTKVRVQSADNLVDTTDTYMEVRALKLSLPDTTILPLSSVVYPVRINSTTSSSVLSGSFRINYTQGYLLPDSILLGGTLLQGALVTFQVFNGYALVSFATSTPLIGSGDLLKLRFKILNPLGSYVGLQNVLINENVQANTKDGYIYYASIPALSINPTYGEFFIGQTQQYNASGGKAPYQFSVTDTFVANMTPTGLLTAKRGGIVKAQVKDSLNILVQTSNLQVYDAALTFPTTGALSGTAINFPVILSNHIGSRPLYSLQLTVSFPTNMLDSVQAVVSGIASGWSVTQNVLSDKIILAFAGATPITTNGILFRIHAKVKPSVGVGNNIYFIPSNVLCNDGDFYLKVNTGYVNVVSSIQNDIGINTIPNLTSSCSKSSQETITGNIYNYNNTTYFMGDTLFVGYKLNSNPIVNDTLVLTSNLNISSSITFNFNTKANLSAAGSYTLKVFTQLSGDINRNNDTSTLSFQVYGSPVVQLGNDISMCSGDSRILNATTPSATYEWSTGANSPTLTVNTAGQYWVKVTSSNGCFAYDTVNVSVKALPPVSSLNGFGYNGICGLDSITLSTTPVSGYTYRWLFNGSNTANPADTLTQLQVINSGTYTVRVTDSLGCSSLMADTVITISTTRQAPAVLSGTTTYCEGDTIKLFASTLTNVTYRWVGPTGFFATSQNIQITNASLADAGVFTVYAIKNGATGLCDTSLSVQISITVNPRPVLTTVSVTGNSTFCQGDSTVLSIAPTSGWRYKWIRNSILLVDSNDTYTAKTSGNYTVKVTSDAGCATTMLPVQITANPKPVTGFITGNATVIKGATYAYQVSNTAGSSYLWLVDKGVQVSGTTTNAIQVTWDTTTGTGFVKVVETNSFGCMGDTSLRVISIVEDIPSVLILNPDTIICQNTATVVKVGVESNVAWMVTNPTTWISLSQMSGTGNDSLTLTIQANTAELYREGWITVSSGTLVQNIFISQAGSVGLNTVDPFAGISIYPNPSTGVFAIENKGTENFNATVLDVNGRTVQAFNFEASKQQVLDYSDRADGLYLLHIENGKVSHTFKLMVHP